MPGRIDHRAVSLESSGRAGPDRRAQTVTNATAEGLDNKNQTIRKKTYGFRTPLRFINAIYFHWPNLSLHPL